MLEIVHNFEGIFLSQRKYTLVIIAEIGLLVSKPASFSMEQHHLLRPCFSDPAWYRRLVGHLIYLLITRPDLLMVSKILPKIIQ